MLAADATGDHDQAIAAATRMVQLEGFGEQWLSLAVLRSRAGDTAGARDAIQRATAHPPIDPTVELNALMSSRAAGSGEPTQPKPPGYCRSSLTSSRRSSPRPRTLRPPSSRPAPARWPTLSPPGYRTARSRSPSMAN